MAKLENLEGLERKLQVEISSEEVNAAYQKRLEKVCSTIKLPGFRPGKVPQSVVETRFSKGLCEEVASELVQNSLPKLVEEQDIKLVGQPRIESGDLKKDAPYQYSAFFEVYPEIELNELSGVEVEKSVAPVTDEDLSETMTQIQQQHADWSEVDRSAIDGDRLKIDFEGFMNGVAFDGGKADGFEVVIGSKKMVPGFEDGLIDLKAGDESEVAVVFPENYQPKDLAGKEATFKIKVHAVSEPTLPELDDELAKKMGVEGGFSELQDKVKANLEREVTNRLKNTFKENLMNSLLDKNEILVPDTLVQAEIKHMQQMRDQQLAAAQGGSKPAGNSNLPTDHFREEALKRVQLGLLLSEVIKKYELSCDQAKVDERINDLASAYPQKEQIVSFYKGNKQMLAQIEAAVLEDQALEKLAESANIKEVTMSFKEVMGEQ